MFWNDIKDIQTDLKVNQNGLLRLESMLWEAKERQELNRQVFMDKIDDYMKNVDRLNVMINEFKGCVSMARAALNEVKTGKKKKK